MAIIRKRVCEYCGKEIGYIGGHRMAEGYLCSSCKKQLLPLIKEFNSELQLDDVTINDIIQIQEAKKHKEAKENKTMLFACGSFLLLLIIGYGVYSSITPKTPVEEVAVTETVKEEKETKTATQQFSESLKDAKQDPDPIYYEQQEKTEQEITDQETTKPVINSDVPMVDGYTKVQSFFFFIQPEMKQEYLEQQASQLGIKHFFRYGGDNGGGDPTSGIILLYIGTDDEYIRFENYPPVEYILVTYMHDELYEYKYYFQYKFNTWIEVYANGKHHTRHMGRLTFEQPEFQFDSLMDALDYEGSFED